MDATDGNSITSKVEDELAVAVYADDIAFASCKNAGEYTQLYMVFGKLLEWVSQKRYSSGLSFNTVMNGCITLSLMEAGTPLHRSFTKWYCG